MRIRSLAFALILLATGAGGVLGQSDVVAEIAGKTIRNSDLEPPANARPPDAAAAENYRRERFRGLAWQALFDDFARSRKIAVTDPEIDSHNKTMQRMQEAGKNGRIAQQKAIEAELRGVSVPEARRKQLESQLATLRQIVDFDRQQELRDADPAQKKIREETDKRVGEQWVRLWKINQALYREFGGRVVFQQGGYEPIDAYRSFLAAQEKKGAIKVNDPALQGALKSYLELNFTYAREEIATAYFAKPWWDWTEAERAEFNRIR
jgi:hypothetical protein